MNTDIAAHAHHVVHQVLPKLYLIRIHHAHYSTARTSTMANPVVRDFNSNSHESGRARAATQTTPSSTPFPIDIEPNVGRHNTLSPPTRQDSEVSLPGLQRRITRSNTIRNYHSDARVPQPGAVSSPIRALLSLCSIRQTKLELAGNHAYAVNIRKSVGLQKRVRYFRQLIMCAELLRVL